MKHLSILLLLFICLISHGQISTRQKPYSLKEKMQMALFLQNRQVLEKPNIANLKKTDEIKEEDFGYGIKVNYNTHNAGQWFDISNGDRLWIMEIHIPEAKSINLNYDKFWLPKGAKLHLYNADTSMYIGAFTSFNNHGKNESPSKFSTGIVVGDKTILELYEPKEVSGKSIISISEVIYGFRCLPMFKEYYENEDKGCFGWAGSCHVNINCSEGDNWQKEKTGVATSTAKNGKCWMTGSLLNNTNHDGTPYFLTAEHGLYGSGGDLSVGDTAQWVFYWDWESSGCPDGSNFDPPSTYGAILVASYPSTDMALFRLLETPQSLPEIDKVYYNGWDRTNSPGHGGVMIHHPAGDIKKIATYDLTPTTSGNRWYISSFESTANGYSIPQGGSSGAPIFNDNHHIIGNHWASASDNCSNPPNEYSYSGKVSVSWNTSGQSTERLIDWIDPAGTTPNSLDGEWYYNCGSELIIENEVITSDRTIEGCEIILDNVTIENNSVVIIDSEWKTTIEKDFEVEIGSTLEIR